MTGLLPPALEACLPDRLTDEIARISEHGRISWDDISEVRLRLDRPASLTISGENIPLGFRTPPAAMSDCVSRLCGGSVYAHGATINEGYIIFEGGIRVGLCGSYSSDANVGGISSLNIRIPHIIRGVGERILRRFREDGRISSTLIYSEPGVGKTTLLRDIASGLGESGRRVAVIDTRGEICIPEMFSDTLCDFLIGYPKAKGIETATRTLSPEVIICDELGGVEETKAILSAQNTGVPLIATAHASDLGSLLSRPNIRILHDEMIFSRYIGVSRERIGKRLSRCFLFDETPVGKISLEVAECTPLPVES